MKMSKQINPFKNSNTNKRYYTYDYYLKTRFGKKCVKIALDGGFSCPNIDGKIGRGGCIYCSENGSGDHVPPCDIPLEEQFEKGKQIVSGKWNDVYYIPYFQAHTNTYAPTDILRQKFEKAIAFENAVGLSIATRPDCLSDETVEYLRELSEKTYLTVELGLQSAKNETLSRINRGHTFEQFLKGYEKLKGINVCIHIINGLPGENFDDMMMTAREINKLKPHALKIHLLYVLKNTKLAQMYEQKEFETMTLENYVNTVCSQLEILNENIIIERVTGDGDKDMLISPLWSIKKTVVANEIDKEFVKRGTYQGFLC